MNVAFRDEGTHLVALCDGVWDPVALTDIAHRIEARAVHLSHDKLLIDCTHVSAPSGEIYRHLAGEDIANILSPSFRVAVLYRRGLINRVAERVALSRGATVLVSHEMAELHAWLLEPRA
jgi:hypothetical protein